MSNSNPTHNPVIWFEIYVQDMPRAQKFYEQVLGVKLEAMPAPDGMPMQMMGFPMNMGALGAAGTLVKMEGVPSGQNSTLIYFACDDCAVEAARVASAGGRLKQEKASIGQYGFIALAFDPDDNLVGFHSMK